ncbi:Hypothetical predicted protein [Octopus vulgaris]|uniref:Uncharacterized protein n=1 Tax=Octopus vulgaris TaxID=6645 RepID=A0AA36ASA5_OCTVU|nr:Hypothetical predicted protein [Octopus vulgaris]
MATLRSRVIKMLIKTQKREPKFEIGALYKVFWLLSKLLKALLHTFSGFVKSSNEIFKRFNHIDTGFPESQLLNRIVNSVPKLHHM